MFGFGKKKSEDMKIDLNQVDLSHSNDMQTFLPRYEYTIKVFDFDENDRPITSIQKAQASSDQQLIEIFAIAKQKIQILEKHEINPPPPGYEDSEKTLQRITQISSTPLQKAEELPVKYFSAGGIEFKMVGQEVFQKQWVNATEEEYQKIRIINDKTNKIVSLDGKHLEIQHWIKVDSTDQV